MTRFNFRNFPILFLAFAIILFTACGDDDVTEPEVRGTIAVSSSSTSFESGRGTSVEIPISVNAEEGIKALTASVDGGAAQDLAVTAGQTTVNANLNYDIPADALFGSSVDVKITATDALDQTSETTVTVNTGALIETPSTYEFTRNGETTVAFSGQNDRLNQLEIIKNEILKAGDSGEIISEQALLDAFTNAGGNGGGLFGFESTKQLGSKTFQPDLDDQLFENMFKSVAEASVAANGGQIAADGTAGLIERSSGKTVLVDANGREFTQLIEKGLMGAVFYNQIFNTYFSDGRTGDDVENTVLREGKNYNDMEHHWDEAFGYWNPPLDFTSNWPAERASEDRFWSHYSNTVDPVIGSNSVIMEAFIAGRAAIVNNDLATKTAKRTEVSEWLELVAAATAIHYINDSQEALNAGEIGDAFHVMSEVWAFVNAIKYYPNRKLTLDQITEINEQDLGANGNFWNVTPEGLAKAKATLVAAYPALADGQDDL